MTQVETNGTAIGAVAGSKTSRTINYEEQKKYDIEKYAEDIYYSERYYDDFNEYRHVFLPSPLRKYLPKPIRLMSEEEWRNLGVQQSVGWEHYMIHEPEPHVLLFKREKNFQQKYETKRQATAAAAASRK